MTDKIENLEEAISSFVTIAARKLREQNGFTQNVTVFIQTNRFRDDLPQYNGCTTVFLDEAANDTMTICQAAIKGLHSIFRNGYKYKRAGVIFSDVVSIENVEHSLFVSNENRTKRRQIMQVLDEINSSNSMHDKVHIATYKANIDNTAELPNGDITIFY